jgi:hypothetical protein
VWSYPCHDVVHEPIIEEFEAVTAQSAKDAEDEHTLAVPSSTIASVPGYWLKPLKSVNVRFASNPAVFSEHSRWSEVSKKVRPHGFKLEGEYA